MNTVNQYSAKSLMSTKLPVRKKTIAWRKLKKRMVINYAVNLITHQFSISGSSLILKQCNWNMAGASLIVALFPLERLQLRTGVKGKEQRRPRSFIRQTLALLTCSLYAEEEEKSSLFVCQGCTALHVLKARDGRWDSLSVWGDEIWVQSWHSGEVIDNV